MAPDAPPPSPEQAAPARSRDLRLGRWLAMLISVTLTGLGVWTLTSGRYDGHNTRSSAAPVALGGLPLALLARNARQRASGPPAAD